MTQYEIKELLQETLYPFVEDYHWENCYNAVLKFTSMLCEEQRRLSAIPVVEAEGVDFGITTNSTYFVEIK